MDKKEIEKLIDIHKVRSDCKFDGNEVNEMLLEIKQELVKLFALPVVSVSLPLFDKGRTLMEAHNYADAVVKKTLFGKSKELAKQRIVSMYLLDEMEKGNER